jgi:hypothetical protein
MPGPQAPNLYSPVPHAPNCNHSKLLSFKIVIIQNGLFSQKVFMKHVVTYAKFFFRPKSFQRKRCYIRKNGLSSTFFPKKSTAHHPSMRACFKNMFLHFSSEATKVYLTFRASLGSLRKKVGKTIEKEVCC